MARRTSLAVTFLAFASLAGGLAAGCSSSSSSQPPPSSTKTCADVAKCCDKLGEPQKSACSAAANAKVENACAASYDNFCAAGDGGTEGGTEGGGEPTCAAAAASCGNFMAPCCDGLVCGKDPNDSSRVGESCYSP